MDDKTQSVQPVGGQVTPPQPVGSLKKEQQPVGQNRTSEFLRPSELPPTLSPEVKEVGVRTTSPFPPLTQEHHQAGIQPAGELVPVPTSPSGIVQLPMTEEEARRDEKHSPTESIRWLASEVLKLLKRRKAA